VNLKLVLALLCNAFELGNPALGIATVLAALP
jgi:hypothetical protein